MPILRKRPPYIYFLVALDWLTIASAMTAAILLRGRDLHGLFQFAGTSLYWEIVFIAAYAAAVVLVFHYFSLYRINVVVSVTDHIIRIVRALVVTVLGIALLAFFVRAAFILDSRLAIIYFTLISFTLFVGGRVIIFRSFLLFMTRHKVFQRNALIIGAGEGARNVAVNIFLHDHIGLSLVGFVDDDVPLGKPVFNGSKVIGRTSELREVVETFDVGEVLVSLENVDQEKFIEVLERALELGRPVKVSSPLYAVIPDRLDMEKYGNIPVVEVSRHGPRPAFVFYKRLFDSIGAGFALLLLAPVFAAVAIGIKLDSPGPVIYTQMRIGKNGKPFRFFKFRSMTSGGGDDKEREEKYAQLIKGSWSGSATDVPMKIVNEARVTRLGAILRRTSLDELPQLFNVLRGDMSLVGPRPCLPYEWKHYEEWHKKRLSVTPGCTGMWQVVGRSQVGFQDMVILDLFYSQNASFHLDLWLLLKTIPVMVLGRGGK
jgi:exopolysaccharide biosynthesis polyprenyl glycosylphosphotransferase